MALITVLHAPKRNLCKVHIGKSIPELKTTPYYGSKHFLCEQQSIDGIEAFSGLLSDLQSDRHRLIIRGTPHPEIDTLKQVSRRNYIPNTADFNAAPFLDIPQHWMMLDIDKLKLPSNINILREPLDAIYFAIKQLPIEFQDVTVHWQLSASAGIRDTDCVSAHLFYWLSEPAATSQRLKQWGDVINKTTATKLIDTHLFQTVQIHYTAAPIFLGMADPYEGRRSGLIRKNKQSVDIDYSVIPIAAARKASPSDTAQGITNGGFDNILSTLGDHGGGDGFNNPLLRATASYARTVGALAAESDREAFKAMLRERINEANQSNHSRVDIDRYQSDVVLDDFITRAIEKYGEQPPPYFDVSELPLYEAQAQLRHTVASFGERVKAYGCRPESLSLDGAPTLAIRATAGLGKTSEIIKTLINRNILEQGDVHYFVPTHKLSEQLIVDLDAVLDYEIPDLFDDGKIAVMRRTELIAGRHQLGQDGQHLCLKLDLVNKVTAIGESVSKTLCKSGAKTCEFYETCGYQQQFDPPETEAFFNTTPNANMLYSSVKVMAHPHLFLRTKDRGRAPVLVVIDEAFWQTGLKEILVSPSDLTTANKPIASFISDKLVKEKTTFLLQDLRNAGYDSNDLLLEAAQIRVETISKDELRPDMSYQQQERLLSERRWENKAPLVLDQLAAELATSFRSKSHSVRYEPSSNKSNPKADKVLVSSRKALEIAEDIPVIFIDANAQLEILEQFRPDVEVVDIPVQRQAVIHQFTDLTFSKTSFKTNPEQIKQVRSFISAVGYTGKTLVVCTKSIRHDLTGIDPRDEKSSLYGNAHVIHFGSLRGLNDYEGFDNIIILGREEPPSNTLEDLARALWWDCEAALASLEEVKGNKPLSNELRTYRGTQFKTAIVSVHPDPRVQMILEQIREAESEQAIDRLRLLRPPSGQQRQVFILSSLPLNVTVNHFYGWKPLQQCLELIEEADGVLPLNPAHLLLRCPSTAITTTAAKRRIADIKRITLLIDILIREVSQLVSYRPEGSSKPSSAIVSTRLSHSEVTEILSRIAGKLRSVQFPDAQ